MTALCVCDVCEHALASTALVFGFTTTLSQALFLLSSNYQGLDLCVQSKKQLPPLFSSLSHRPFISKSLSNSTAATPETDLIR